MSHYVPDKGPYALSHEDVAYIKGVINGSTGENSHASFVFEKIIYPRIVGYHTNKKRDSDISCACGDEKCKNGISISYNLFQFSDNDGEIHLMKLSKESAQKLIDKLNETINELNETCHSIK